MDCRNSLCTRLSVAASSNITCGVPVMMTVRLYRRAAGAARSGGKDDEETVRIVPDCAAD